MTRTDKQPTRHMERTTRRQSRAASKPDRRAAPASGRRRLARSVLRPAVDGGIALGAGLGADGGWHGRCALLAVVTAGLALNAFFLLSHDGHHRLLFRARVNHAANILLCIPLLHSPWAYRVLHELHHRYLGGPGDPDEFHNYTSDARLRWALHWVRLTIGTLVYMPLIPVIAWRRAGAGDRAHRFRIRRDDRHLVAGVRVPADAGVAPGLADPGRAGRLHLGGARARATRADRPGTIRCWRPDRWPATPSCRFSCSTKTTISSITCFPRSRATTCPGCARSFALVCRTASNRSRNALSRGLRRPLSAARRVPAGVSRPRARGRSMRLTLVHPCIGRRPGQYYIRTWQMEPLAPATLAGLTPPESRHRHSLLRRPDGSDPVRRAHRPRRPQRRDLYRQALVSDRVRIPPARRPRHHGWLSSDARAR